MYYLNCLRSFKTYTIKSLRADLLSGFIVALVALPLAMSFAISIGVEPQFGVYAAIIGGFVAALFGGSEVNVTGPTGAFIAILSGVVLAHGYDGLLVAGLLAGVFLFLAGLFGFGTLISYIPYPVTIGFTTGIAVIIFVSQLGTVFGIPGLERHEYLHENVIEFFTHLSGWSVSAVSIAALTAFLMVFIPRFGRTLPAALIAILITSILANVLGLDVSTIQSVFGGISQELPALHLPSIRFGDIIKLLPAAFAIAMLGSIESLLSCVVSDSMTRKKHNSNMELIGQGLANIITPLFGGIPVTGAIARTAVNAKSGAESRLAAMFHSLILFAIILLFAPLVSYVPLAALGGVLMIVAYRMSEVHHVRELVRHGEKTDVAVLFTTMLLTIFVNLTISIPVGLVLASLLFIKRISELGVVQTSVDRKGKEPKFVPHDGQVKCPHLNIYTVQGPLFFGAARAFMAAMNAPDVHQTGALILRLKHVPVIDASGVNALRDMVTSNQHHPVYLSGVQPHVMEQLRKHGVINLLGKKRLFDRTHEAISQALVDLGLPNGCEEYRVKE